MLSDDEISRAGAQLRNYQQDDTLSQILERYGALIEDYKRLKSDYEEERDARERYKQMAKGQDRNPFVLVLIDGDGYVFNDNLVDKSNPDAGRNAAHLLHDRVQESLRRKGLEHCAVMVRVYANVAGLSKVLAKAGLVGQEGRSLSPFVANFNKSYGLFDFVDAGPLKENADFKLRAMLKLHAENAQCKHIYFAACHDVGYISELTSFVGKRDLFTLIKTPGINFHDEYTKLGLGVEELHGVFRPTPLSFPVPSTFARAASMPSSKTEASTLAQGASKIVKTPSPDNNKNGNTINNNKPANGQGTFTKSAEAGAGAAVCQHHLAGRCSFGQKCRNLHVSGSARTNAAWRDGPGQAKSPDHAKQASSPDEFRNLPNKEDIPLGHVAVNEMGFRLDPYLPPSSVQAAEVIKSRASRVCNIFHLTGDCPKGQDECEYDHSPLSEHLKKGVEYLSRTFFCHHGGSCRDPECIQGHICQLADCQKRGGRRPCKIRQSAHLEKLFPVQYVPGIARSRGSRKGSISDLYSYNDMQTHRRGSSQSPSIETADAGARLGGAVLI
ncbi:hypothetical protein MCOR27_002193 [Pyricularia oryzae]|uniref:C3H1-type domain-containing protein n=2 Tax=Pyricularia TaxID=48558 RepID=A0ABQ8NHT8_PYRGI|nr:hypothetical protein MCOR01_003541 [Pyricularia oryzae]KAI6296759.1 hypothetical protein MCOR33_006703 [Pyricularia grisea]KAH9432147.1 hypothetical protein MCOR02_006852 [Pyricularia oryzae]KAI6257141.1 hypothetical protein MCOR19_006458 [Pyricularia oryzae]KAI6273339.1 hypothetical protein MCOR26_006931 [Pyricularia oryzae]